MRQVKPRVVGSKSWSVRGKQCRVVEVSFSGHYRIRSRRLEATVDVRVVEDISIGEDGYRDCFLDCSDLAPIGESLRWKRKFRGGWILNRRVWTHSIVPSLFPDTPVAGNDLSPSSFEHLGVFNRLLNTRENPELSRHGDG